MRERSAGKAADNEAASQKRRTLERYRLQVDRQTKSSFQNLAEAEKAGADIKKKFPVVHISIFDATKGETKII
jgi:hypothetical protein